ncbi:MAG: heavy-metal-associated domain-containing protein [Tenuifilaceae bacterium]|jgi:copper chaperone CopZ|nr:heavy-metal-associated domain-containing protein [Tenuifilaceae bacterium]
METLTLTIPNMKCMGCSTTIENHLKKVGGVTEVKANPENRSVEVSYSGDLSTKKLIIKTLKGIGYPAEEVNE